MSRLRNHTIHQPHFAMTRVKLDAAFYPHIIDEIFDHACPTTLLALRVNREWRQRAERKVASHVCVGTFTTSDSPPCPALILKTQTKSKLGVFRSGPAKSTAPSFIKSVAVVDLHVPKFDKKVAALFGNSASDVVIRIPDICHFTAPPSLVPKARRVVLFCKDIPKASAIRDSKYLSRHRLDRVPGQKHIVIHLRAGGVGGAEPFTSLRDSVGELGSMALIVHPWDVLPRLFGGFAERPYVVEFGMLADLIVLAYVKNVPVTVVNLLEFEVFARRHPNPEDFKNRILERVAEAKGSYTTYPTASTYSPVRFLTMEEYRAEVGEELFQIDTVDEGRLWPLSPKH